MEEWRRVVETVSSLLKSGDGGMSPAVGPVRRPARRLKTSSPSPSPPSTLPMTFGTVVPTSFVLVEQRQQRQTRQMGCETDRQVLLSAVGHQRPAFNVVSPPLPTETSAAAATHLSHSCAVSNTSSVASRGACEQSDTAATT